MQRTLFTLVGLMMLVLAFGADTTQAQSGVLWTTRFYNNPTLTDPPVVQRTDNNIAFNWGAGSPAGSVPADNFSARFSTKTFFNAGVYRFTVTADDGVHLIFDNVNFLIDTYYQSKPGQTLTAQVTVPSAGEYHLQLDYREATGDAYVYLNWEYLGATAPSNPPPNVPGGLWTAEYYTNASLSGAPYITTNEPSPTHNWGANAPYAGMNPDNFSVRWRSSQYLNGSYRISVRSDDGVRVYLDNSLLINAWAPSDGSQTFIADFTPSPGFHNLTVEYFEGGGMAWLDFNLAIATPQPTPTPQPGVWIAEYFSNPNLAAPVAWVTNESPNRNWGLGSPGALIPADNFSARFRRNITLNAGTYRIRARADDGVRVYLNGIPYINEWHASDAQTYTRVVTLPGGTYSTVVEYYEGGGHAMIDVTIEQTTVINPTPQPPPQVDSIPASGTAIIRAGRLNVRNAPSTITGAIIDKVNFGETYAVVARLRDRSWYQIRVRNQTGWVSGRYIRVTDSVTPPVEPPANTWNLATTANLSLRFGPSTTTTRLTVIPRGTILPILARNVNSTWFKVIYDGRTGWVIRDYVTIASGVNLTQIPVE